MSHKPWQQITCPRCVRVCSSFFSVPWKLLFVFLLCSVRLAVCLLIWLCFLTLHHFFFFMGCQIGEDGFFLFACVLYICMCFCSFALHWAFRATVHRSVYFFLTYKEPPISAVFYVISCITKGKLLKWLMGGFFLINENAWHIFAVLMSI